MYKNDQVILEKKRLFPVDMFAVKIYGIQKWQDEFSWPVSDKEFFSLAEAVEKSFVEHVNNEKKDISDLLLIKRFLPFEYWHFLHALMVIKLAKSDDMDILCSDRLPWYEELITGAYINKNSNIKIVRHNLKSFTFYENFKIRVRSLLKNIIYNPNPLKYFKFNNKWDVRAYGSAGSHMKQYINKLPKRVSFTSQIDWVPKNHNYDIPEEQIKEINRISHNIINDLKSIAYNHGINLLEPHIEYLKKLTQNELVDAQKVLSLVEKQLKKSRKKIHLLISALGGPLPRAFAVAVRNTGGKVTSFSHGGHIGLYDTPTFALSEFALSDEFIAYTETSSELFKKIKDNHSPLKDNKFTIRHANIDDYQKMHEKYCRRKPVKKVNTIMLLGYPGIPWRVRHSSASLSLMQLDLELRTVKLLKKQGYDLIYKAHPDRLQESKGIFEDMAQVLYKGYFEDYMDLADLYVFFQMKSTAFSSALCTNRPIIAFKMKDEPFKPFMEPMQLLEKRCSIIQGSFDERNRIILDEKRLQGALNKLPKQINNEFINKYMFPTR